LPKKSILGPSRGLERASNDMTPDQIRKIRLKLGLTLAEMAYLLGYQGENLRQQMHDLETGRRPIREPQRRLAEAYRDGYRPADWPRDHDAGHKPTL
jgi:transcriptional regulator with XRE-family HTH domain